MRIRMWFFHGGRCGSRNAENDKTRDRILENMISLQHVQRFFRKTPEQRRTTARFLTAMWLAKLPYAPHRIQLEVAPGDRVKFWWSYFPASFHPDRSLFEYWDDDLGDLRFLWNYLRSGMTFLDIGAYHGLYSVMAAKKLGRAGRVVAFEPSLRERRKMQLHLRYNGVESVAVGPYALAAEPGQASLSVVVNGFTTMNSLRPPPIDHPTRQVVVDTTSLDAYLDRKQMDRVDLVKIDTEGGEVQAFRGAEKLLRGFRPLIICEVLDLVTRSWGYAAADIMTLLRTYDYEWFDILPTGNLRPHHPRTEYPEGRNYLAVPQEKQSSVRSALLAPLLARDEGAGREFS
jgi:FkbM family methyltransferase